MNTGHRSHTGIFAFEPTTPNADDENTIVIPEDLTELSDEDLDESVDGSLASRAVAAFDALLETEPDDAESITALNELAAAIETLRGELQNREQVREEAREQAAALRSRIHGTDEEEGAAANDAEGGGGEAGEQPAPAPESAPAPQPASEPESVAAGGRRTEPAQPRRTQRINVPFSEIRARAPQQEVTPALSIVAAADVPRYTAGAPFANIEELAEAFRERAKTTPTSTSGQVTGPKVATVKNHFDHVVSRDTSPADIERMMKEITNPASLVAGGGWCAPSEVTYSFFNIACEDGTVDLPEFGVQRGGIRWPVSPSMADVFTGTFTNATNPWLWTESDDILTVTGAVNKPCVRVPCPTFSEARLECYGICLTAGNLTDNAYPEATENQTGLLRSAHYHAMNQRYIASMVALATTVAVTGIADDANGISTDLLAHIGWAALDYRTRFGMCENDVLEVVLPFWIREIFRADLSRRNGLADPLAVSDAEIDGYFDVRKVRIQYVKDWQVRAGNQPGGATATQIYPPTVQWMIYAAGTFSRGNGMTLDLGVVRDSVLNAENDHTSLWTEECHLIAMFGHQARLYTTTICAAGRSGSANITTCGTAA